MNFFTLDDLPLTTEVSVKRNKRFQRVTFGDGYSQILSDGLNADKEIWTCSTPPIDSTTAFAIESFLKINADSAIPWSPPDSAKSFVSRFGGGILNLGYSNISSLALEGYTRPTDYTANLTTGMLTSVTIADGVNVTISLTESPKNFLLRDGWNLQYVSDGDFIISFELERIYV